MHKLIHGHAETLLTVIEKFTVSKQSSNALRDRLLFPFLIMSAD